MCASKIVIGTNQILTLTAISVALGHQHGNVFTENMLNQGIFLFDDVHKLKMCKLFSVAVRRTHRLPSGINASASITSAICYFELCSGRSNNNSNWNNEVVNRSTKTNHIQIRDIQEDELCTNTDAKIYNIKWRDEDEIIKQVTQDDEDFYLRLDKSLHVLMTKLLPENKVVETFAEFCQRRNEWVVAGSGGGVKIAVPKTSILIRDSDCNKVQHSDGYHIRVDKRAYLEALDLKEMLKFLDLEPFEHAIASDKWENGKARAIYGVHIIHYIINTYCTYGLEERFHAVEGLEKGLRGIKEFAGMNKRADICVKKQDECSMLDYADFNIQHTPRAQAAIFKCLAQLGIQRGYAPDWIKANNWIAAAKYKCDL